MNFVEFRWLKAGEAGKVAAGRARPDTTCVNTIGTTGLCSRRATVTGVLFAKIRSGALATSSVAWSRSRFPAQRYSIERLRPLTHPSSRRPFKAVTRDCASGLLATRPNRTPIRRVCFVCPRRERPRDRRTAE
jgi:hypothetical protein